MALLDTSTLTGLPLDFAVAQIRGYSLVTEGDTHRVMRGCESLPLGPSQTEPSFSPSTLDYQARKIREREGMKITPPEHSNNGRGTITRTAYWTAEIPLVMSAMGVTEAIAISRCFVFAHRGAKVEVPDALL